MSHLASEATSVLEKRTAAATGAALVESGMTLGLGTGSTVAYLLPILASRRLRLRCVATSVATERAARRAGLRVESFDALDELDLAVDGADQVHRSGWLVKGGGGAHTREKIVAAAARRFIVIASSDKLVDELRPPVPLELLAYGVPSTLRTLGPTRLRGLVSPDGGLIADYTGPIGDPGLLASRFAGIPGLVEHGMFAPELVTEIFVARGRDVERIEGRRR